MNDIFTRFLAVELPSQLICDEKGSNPAFSVTLTADGAIPFPQVILRQHGHEHLFRNQQIVWLTDNTEEGYQYRAEIPAGLLSEGEIQVQIEGCRQANFTRAGGDDWIKTFRALHLVREGRATPSSTHSPGTESGAGERKGIGSNAKTDAGSTQSTDAKAATKPSATPRISAGKDLPKLYFGIHKHMHQPYYDAANPDYWDGEKDGIFSTRGGPYTDFVPAAIRQYADSGLPHAGLSCSWSGSLIEQLERCAETGRAGGRFSDWTDELRRVAKLTTASGNRRLDLSAFGFYHPLMPLIPARNIVRQIQQHRELIPRIFGAPASDILFPPETAFHPRIIPALNQAGIRAVIYDSIHRYRACRDYPYGGPNEGMLPPNPAEQTNPPADDWLRLSNVWTGSDIAPSLLKPEYLAYTDPDGTEHKIIGVPAERYIGNEDARGGFGALQYPDVLGQVYAELERHGHFDPKHPPFFLLHSDGDNHGGGAESYYRHNTAALLEWLAGDPRFELTTIADYLDRFPPDPSQAVHLEPGSWSGADNGDPQFMKWFSRYREPYSPDLNSWAVLTALQNAVHSLEDTEPEHPLLPKLARLMLTAEASDYWYWTGQDVWDGQVTRAANQAWSLAGTEFQRMADAKSDKTGPTIFPPWVTPENPGGQQWRPNGLEPAPREATLHCFAYDLSGIARVRLHLRPAAGDPASEQVLEMIDHGPYPCETGARVTAHYFTAELPPGLGDVRYFLVAEDKNGNLGRSALERIYLA